jgi:hypothetical protein
VAFHAAWLLAPWAALTARLRRTPGRIVEPQYIERLRSRKEEVARDVAKKSKLAPSPATRSPEPAAASPPDPSTPPPTAEPPQDYTSRLLRAKRKVWTDRRDGESNDPESRPQ